MPHKDHDSRPQDDAASRNEALDALRRRIDAYDDAILAAIEQRVGAAREIAELKRSDRDSRLRMRPAREAAVVERMVGKAENSPERLVRQVWQEIMASCLNLQIHTELILFADSRPALVTDAMRRRFGCAGRMTVVASPEEAMEAARSCEAVAVLELDEGGAWTLLKDDPVLAMFDCLRDPEGKPIAVAAARIAAEDLKACPDLRVVPTGTGDGELLASTGEVDLILAAAKESGR
jgi:chorismate mutase